MHEDNGFIFSLLESLVSGRKMFPELRHTDKMEYQQDCTADNCQTPSSHPSQSHRAGDTSSQSHYSPKSEDLWVIKGIAFY